jgi:hypothetical protein
MRTYALRYEPLAYSGLSAIVISLLVAGVIFCFTKYYSKTKLDQSFLIYSLFLGSFSPALYFVLVGILGEYPMASLLESLIFAFIVSPTLIPVFMLFLLWIIFRSMRRPDSYLVCILFCLSAACSILARTVGIEPLSVR